MLPSSNASPPRPPRRLAIWLIGTVVLALLVAATAAIVLRQDGGADAEVGAGPSPSSSSTTEATDAEASPTTSTTAAGPQVPSRLKQQFDELQAQTAEIRRLQWKGPLDLRVVSRSELSRLVREVVARDTDP